MTDDHRQASVADEIGVCLRLPAFDGGDLRLRAESFLELRSVARHGHVPAIGRDRHYSQDLRSHDIPACVRTRGRRTPNPERGCHRGIREPKRSAEAVRFCLQI